MEPLSQSSATGVTGEVRAVQALAMLHSDDRFSLVAYDDEVDVRGPVT
jgi:hypothetical protein